MAERPASNRSRRRRRCARCEKHPHVFAPRLLSCYLHQLEGDAERAHGSLAGGLAHSPRRLQTLGAGDHQSGNGVLRTRSFSLPAEVVCSHLPQLAACARVRALACPDGHFGRHTAPLSSWRSAYAPEHTREPARQVSMRTRGYLPPAIPGGSVATPRVVRSYYAMYAVCMRPGERVLRVFQDRPDAAWLRARSKALGRLRVSRFCRLPATDVLLQGQGRGLRLPPSRLESMPIGPFLTACALWKSAPAPAQPLVGLSGRKRYSVRRAPVRGG